MYFAANNGALVGKGNAHSDGSSTQDWMFDV
jgi:hypothetical protein